jgi:hypothetical protein
MSSFILPVISAFLCAVIEYLRIKSTHGKVANISKFWSVTIAFVFFGLCLALSVDYYDYILPHHVLFYGLYFVGCRGMIYDVTLNLFRGLKYNYTSYSTNSIFDRIFVRYSTFFVLKIVFLLIMIIFGYLWQLR